MQVQRINTAMPINNRVSKNNTQTSFGISYKYKLGSKGSRPRQFFTALGERLTKPLQEAAAKYSDRPDTVVVKIMDESIGSDCLVVLSNKTTGVDAKQTFQFKLSRFSELPPAEQLGPLPVKEMVEKVVDPLGYLAKVTENSNVQLPKTLRRRLGTYTTSLTMLEHLIHCLQKKLPEKKFLLAEPEAKSLWNRILFPDKSKPYLLLSADNEPIARINRDWDYGKTFEIFGISENSLDIP